jgi:hypothetical protein
LRADGRAITNSLDVIAGTQFGRLSRGVISSPPTLTRTVNHALLNHLLPRRARRKFKYVGIRRQCDNVVSGDKV